MKKLLGLLAIFLMFNSCDDGDLDTDNIDFGDTPIVACTENDILYKLNGTEVLIVLIPGDQNPYQNIEGIETYPINSTTQVRYRLYNGTVSKDNICATIQPGTPQISEEWIAVGGNIIVDTKAELSPPNETTGATKITKYIHEITFENIVYAKPDGSTIIFAKDTFGDYTTNPTDLPFNFNKLNTEVEKCNTNNTVYNVAEPSSLESLVINNISETLIDGNSGPNKQPIGNTTNNVVYKLYETAIPITPADYFCVSPTPLLPRVLQTWTAKIGDPNTEEG